MGTPSRPEDKSVLPQMDKMDNTNWQDPELLRDIEAATGLNLQMPQKKKGGKKNKGEQGLTNIREKQNTVRNRLEKKIFNRSAMKRVAADMNLSESKRFKK